MDWRKGKIAVQGLHYSGGLYPLPSGKSRQSQRQHIGPAGTGQGRALLVYGDNPLVPHLIADKECATADHSRRACRIKHDGLQFERRRFRWRGFGSRGRVGN